MNARNGLFYGWWVLGAAFVGEMLAIGSTIYAFGLFVKPICEAFGISRAAANSGMMLFYVGMGLSAPLLGRWMDRHSIRRLMVAGALAMAAGMAIVALSSSIVVIAAAIVLLMAPGSVAIGPLVANTLATRWFSRRRGLALGLAAVATSIGGSVIVPMTGFVLAEHGWRTALFVQAGLIVVLMPLLALWVIHDRPQDRGLLPDGDAEPHESAVAASQEAVWTTRALLRERSFWCIGLSVALVFATNQALLVSLVPYATDAGISLGQATLLMSAMAICSVAGKLVFGALADRVDKRWLLLFVAACMTLLLLALIAKPSFPVLLVLCCLGGIATGGELPLWAAMVAERFGQRSFGGVLGLMNPINTLVTLLAIRFVGQAFDTRGNYDFAFQVFIVAMFVAAVLILLIPRRRPPAAGLAAPLSPV
ncbi:MAG: MFS transporter [Solimonas sp.]